MYRSSMELSASGSRQQNQSDTLHRTAELNRALLEGNLRLVRSFSVAELTAKINRLGDRALHVAVIKGQTEIVRELVNSLLPDPELLELRNNYNDTPLNLAAIRGIVEIAQLLVERNPALLGMENRYDDVPLVVAAEFGHKRMVNFLYERTPEDVLTRSSCKHGARLLKWCIATQFYEIAVKLAERDSKLAEVAVLTNGGEMLKLLARRPAAFRCGSDFSIWQRWIYSCVQVQPTTRGSSRTIAHHLGHSAGIFLKDYVPSVKHVYEKKLEHAGARKLLSCILKQLGSRVYETGTETVLFKLLLRAVLCGNVDFIAEVTKIHPDVVWFENPDDAERPLLSYAILNSQAEVYRFMFELSASRCMLDTNPDEKGNSIIHQAAVLSPPRQLSSIPGPALQMQRELQWFKEVQRIAPAYIEFVNADGKTAGEVFTEEHRVLVREGEGWMNRTAKSYIVVAALIVTIMFAAPFTAPGGYQENTGIPIYLHSNYYILFVVSDALSLFFSTTSVLVFLGMLTSLYREEDFLKSLPTKLIIGLSTLFLSIVAMMVAFSAGVLLMLREHYVWITLPIIMLASIPVTLFVVFQFPLLLQIFKSTYCRLDYSANRHAR